MEGSEELRNSSYESVGTYNSLPGAWLSFTVPGGFGPMIWGMSETPFQSERRESGALRRTDLWA